MRQRSTRPDRQYAAIPNAMMRDTTLSIEARGMLALLMTYADDWVFRKDHLIEVSGMGRDKFERVMRELRDAGYVSVDRGRGENGRVSGSTWVLRDEPNRHPENPDLGATDTLKNRPPEKPAPGKSGPLRRPTDKKTKNKNICAGDETSLFSADAKPQPRAKTDEVERGFETFWKDIWPRHKRKLSRADCLKAYRDACAGRNKNAERGVTPEELNSAAGRYIASVRDDEYLKGTLPWLRAAGWEPFLETSDSRQRQIERAAKQRSMTDWMEVVR